MDTPSDGSISLRRGTGFGNARALDLTRHRHVNNLYNNLIHAAVAWR